MTAASAALAAWTAQTPEERKATGFPLPPIVHTKWNDRTSIPHRAQECVDGWQIKNPSATVLVWTDADTNAFVQLHFPAWWPVYSRLPRNVMKVDIVRNMLLAVYGGVWADIDACPLRPLSDWGLGASDKLVVGTEADMESSVWPTHFARKFQFCTWTFASVPGHPVMAEFLHRTGAKLDERRNTSGAYSPPITDGDVLDFTGISMTGPGMFTDAVFSYLGQHGDTSFDAMHFMPSRMHFGDATVLPLWQFSPGSTQTGTSRPTYSRNHLDPEALVLHLFLGSWRDGKY
ncbi:nucleotide-diphospho-sugar transferase [Blastocladiella britannica]|nr:nucleotide-diphospho-sugar transferase [Blastocladiella britannica]